MSREIERQVRWPPKKNKKSDKKGFRSRSITLRWRTILKSADKCYSFIRPLARASVRRRQFSLQGLFNKNSACRGGRARSAGGKERGGWLGRRSSSALNQRVRVEPWCAHQQNQYLRHIFRIMRPRFCRWDNIWDNNRQTSLVRFG